MCKKALKLSIVDFFLPRCVESVDTTVHSRLQHCDLQFLTQIVWRDRSAEDCSVY